MARILKDKKMVFSVFFLPVIIMVALLTIINSLAGQMQSDIEDHKSIVWMQNEPESFEAFLSSAGMEYSVRTVDSDSDRAEAEDQILNGKADLLIEFPENFDQLVAGFQEGDPVPQVKTYYNPSEDSSAQAGDFRGCAGVLSPDPAGRAGGKPGRHHCIYRQFGQ